MLDPHNIVEYLLSKTIQDLDRCVYIWQNENITVGDLRSRVYGFAERLQDLPARSCVVLALDDCPEWIVAFHAMILCGIIPVVVDSRFDISKLQDIVNRTNSIAIIGNQHWSSLGIKTFVRSDIVGNGSQFNEYRYKPTDDVAYYTTSGTTSGNHKLVVYSHGSLVSLIDRSTYLHQGARILCPARLSFVVGLLITIMAPLTRKSTNVLYHLPPSGLRNIHELINQHSITHFFTAPSVIQIINRNSRANFGSHLTQVYSSGEPLPPLVAKAFEDKFRIRLTNAYGSTETLLTVLLNTNSTVDATLIGTEINDCKVKIVDEAGNNSTVGRLVIQSPACASRYHGDENQSQATFKNGWYYTGDVFTLEHGVYKFVDRVDQFVKVRGCYTSSLDIENLITQVPDVVECAVTFDKDGLGFNQSVAFVVKKSDSKLAGHQLRTEVSRLSNSQGNLVPDQIFFVTELPKTFNNKKIKSIDKLQQNVC